MSLWGDLGRTFQSESTTSTEAMRWSKPGMFTEEQRLVSFELGGRGQKWDADGKGNERQLNASEATVWTLSFPSEEYGMLDGFEQRNEWLDLTYAFKRIGLAPVLKSAEDKGIIETMRPCRGILVTQVSNENDLGHGSCWSGDEKWLDIFRQMWFSCIFPCVSGELRYINLGAWLMKLLAVGWQL